MKALSVAACRFFTAEQACRMALKAYFAAGRRIQPPPGEPFVVDGVPWSSPADFGSAFVAELHARLALLELERLGTFDAAASDWNIAQLASELEPEKMASLIAARQAELAEEQADSFCPKGNSLPPPHNAPHNAATVGPDNV